MRLAIHQPQYWPWPPYIHKVLSADVFVYLDTVQFSKNGLQNRNQIKSPRGALWLTLPVRHRLGQRILETRIADMKATEKHLRTIAGNYARTRGYQLWKHEIEELLHNTTDSLCDVAVASTEWILRKVGASTVRLRASEITEVKHSGSALIASFCESLGATSYLSGAGALSYMKRDDFSRLGCQVWVQEWTTLVYEQAHPEVGFIADLSALDLLLNAPDNALPLLQSNGRWKLLWDTA